MKFGHAMELQHVTSYRATLSAPEAIGAVAEGLRLNIYVTGGEVLGPRIKGKIRPAGADWLTIRTDGVGILDVRATIETHDGALIYTYYRGVAETGPDGYKDFLAGKPPPASGIPLRIHPVYQTSHPNYLWVNRAFCIGVGKAVLEKGEVSYDVYEVAQP